MISVLLLVGRPPTAPRNLTLLSNSTQTGVLVVNLTWTLPEQTHGNITRYVVELYFNGTSTTIEMDTKVTCLYLPAHVYGVYNHASMMKSRNT